MQRSTWRASVRKKARRRAWDEARLVAGGGKSSTSSGTPTVHSDELTDRGLGRIEEVDVTADGTGSFRWNPTLGAPDPRVVDAIVDPGDERGLHVVPPAPRNFATAIAT